jgi:hypothetical protein
MATTTATTSKWTGWRYNYTAGRWSRVATGDDRAEVVQALHQLARGENDRALCLAMPSNEVPDDRDPRAREFRKRWVYILGGLRGGLP